MFTPIHSELVRVLVDQRTRPGGRSQIVRARLHEEQRRRVRQSLLMLPEPPFDRERS
jgi:hypothetical protein